MSKATAVKPLKVKGLRTPRLCLWVRGFLHGRLHTGGIDSQTNTLSSGYITGQISRLNSACLKRIQEAALKLEKGWTEADQLLIELANISADCQPPNGRLSAQLRAREKYAAERLRVLKRLSELANAIRSEVELGNNQMALTENLLLSCFSSYGHGLILKPVSEKLLPVISRTSCDGVFEQHRETWEGINIALNIALKKEED